MTGLKRSNVPSWSSGTTHAVGLEVEGQVLECGLRYGCQTIEHAGNRFLKSGPLSPEP